MRARSGTPASLGEPALGLPGQTLVLVARVITSVKLSERPSWLQCRCSQRWHDEKRTGVPSVRVMASAVTRSLPHSGHWPEWLAPACVSDAGWVDGLAVRCEGMFI